MRNNVKRIIAIILVMLFALSANIIGIKALTVYSEPTPESGISATYKQGRVKANILGFVVQKLASAIVSILPDPDWPDKADYKLDTTFKGNGGDFNEEPTAAKWKAGYSARSILPPDITNGSYVSAGYFGNFPNSPITGVENDQRVRVVALDAGDGVALFITCDAYGYSSTNVKLLREYIADSVAGKNVISINFSSSHAHCLADVHGLGVNLADVLKENVKSIFTRNNPAIENLNPKLMQSLFDNAKLAVEEALADLREGGLSYAAINAKDIIGDKQLPIAYDPNINLIKFVPDDGTPDIWLFNVGCHPTIYPSGDPVISYDYPGTVAQFALEQCDGARVAFFQGAECSITRKAPPLPEGTPETKSAGVNHYAQLLLDRVKAADASQFTALEPILNITSKEIFLPMENPIMWIGCTLKMINNPCLMTNGKVEDSEIVTEIGFCELGKSLVIMLLPGEFSAEIIWGGAQQKELSWNNSEWKYAPLADSFGGKKVICFGLTNDQIGYVIPDNDFAGPLADSFKKEIGDNNKHYEELLSLGRHSASLLVEEYIKLIDAAK